MEKEACDPIQMTEKTRFGLTFGQIISLLSYTTLVVLLYTGLRRDVDELMQDRAEQKSINTQLLNSINEMNNTLIWFKAKDEIQKQD
jgi:hypothetical protein